MKFTKEDAYKQIVSKVPNKGQTLNISERSINEMLDTLIPLVANEETELNDFVDKILPAFKSADLNIKNDVTVGIKEYKDKNPIVEPKKTIEPPKDDANAQLLARLEALEKKNQESEIALRNQGVKKDLTAKMKELGIKNDKWIEMMIGNVTITDDFDVETNASNFLEVYNSMMSDVDPSITPKSTGGGKHDYISDSIKKAAEIAKQQNLIG